MKQLLLVGLVILAGCGGNPLKIENRVVCSVDHAKAYVLGDIGFPFGSSLPISDKDALVICTVPAPGVK